MCELDSNHDDELYCGNCDTCHECIAEGDLEDAKLQIKLKSKVNSLGLALGETIDILEDLLNDPEVVNVSGYIDKQYLNYLKGVNYIDYAKGEANESE